MNLKQTVKYTAWMISQKLKLEVRISIDDKGGLWKSTFGDGSTTALNYFPNLSLTITRPTEEGKRAQWNPNDILSMNKYNYPIFLEYLKTMQENMKIPELYSYVGKRLELDDKTADKVRMVFKIGNTTLELSAVIIQTDDENRVEGIKIKFNNETSTVSLTLNEFHSLIHNIEHLDVDTLCMLMFINYVKQPERPANFTPATLNTTNVDILPKADDLPF